ncbi:MAG: VPGUxxT family thioredoxin-like (seleno)protein, type 2 [Flammeovirgaceae bacterium]
MFKNVLALLGLVFILAVITQAVWSPERSASVSTTQHQSDNPIELGKVNWIRDYDEGKKQSAATNKPIFLLFQEVPGCMTCKDYGADVLSHPLVVEAIESAFVPVAIYNNLGGKDRSVLQSFREPSWNNPVVRFVDSQNKDLVPRLSGDYTVAGLVKEMVNTLEQANKTVPTYLSLLHEELQANRRGTETATFSMHCFWTGESRLGSLAGVVKTEAGFMNGQEVVQLAYDPNQISFVELTTAASKSKCARMVFTDSKEKQQEAAQIVGTTRVAKRGTFRKDREPKYHLGRTTWRFVPMTELQKIRVNTALSQRQSPWQYLSARQVALHKYIDKHPNKGWKNVIESNAFFADWRHAFELADNG